jgi:hypothetical protein
MAQKPVRRPIQAEEAERRRMPVGQYNTLLRVREQMARSPAFARVVTGLSNSEAELLRARLAAEKAAGGLGRTPVRERVMEDPRSAALLMAAKRANFGSKTRGRQFIP